MDIFNVETADLKELKTCFFSPINENDEKAADEREAYLKKHLGHTIFMKLAYETGEILGFVHGLKSSHPLSQIEGDRLLVIPCIHVHKKSKKKVGTALIKSMELLAKEEGLEGVAVIAFSENAMLPLPFFEKCGYKIEKRHGKAYLLVKHFNDEKPTKVTFRTPEAYEGLVGFYNPFCYKSLVNRFSKEGEIVFINSEEANVGIIDGIYLDGKKQV